MSDEYSDSSKFVVEKLNGVNYAAWKFKVKMLLSHKGLWEVVDGTASNAALDKKALSVIGLSVSDSQIVHIMDCDTGKTAWDKLSSLYENKGVANRMHLMEELMTAKMEPGDKSHVHIEKMRGLVGRLGTIGTPISDEQYKMALLRSLPSSYESLVVTLENLIDNLTVEDIHARIIREESRKSKSSTDVDMDSSVEGLFQAKDIRCHHCGKKGHKKFQCWKLKAERRRKNERRNRDGGNGRTKGSGSHAFMANARSDNVTTSWYIDSGASYHSTSNTSLFLPGSLREVKSRRIELADGSHVTANQIGQVSGTFTTDEGEFDVTLKDVLYVPKLNVNLISVGAIQQNGYSVLFRRNVCRILRESDGECALSASRTGRSYVVGFTSKTVAYSAKDMKQVSRRRWHNRLGHPSPKVVDTLVKKSLIDVSDVGTTSDDSKNCGACLEGKMTRRHFEEVKCRDVNQKLRLVHSDLCGPMSVKSLGGAWYFLVIVDDFTRFTYVAFLKKKSDTLDEFKSFVNLMSTQGHGKVRALRTDNGKEYVNGAYKNYLRSKGIEHQPSAPYTPEQNGLAERTNRTLVEKARCILRQAKLPTKYWAEAISTACYLKNITPTRVIDENIPRHEFMGKSVSYGHLRTFGCAAYVHVPKERRKKFDPVSRPCIFVGYTATTKKYRFIDPITKRLVVCATAVFQEDKICRVEGNLVKVVMNVDDVGSLGHQVVNDSENSTEDVVNSTNDTESVDETTGNVDEVPSTPTQTLRRSTRHSTPPKRLTYEYADTDDDEDVAAMFTSEVDDGQLTYHDVTTGHDADEWKSSMQREYDALIANGTWNLVPLPDDKKAIPCRWVYKVKPATRAEPQIYKSRLVAKGFKQIYGVDYDDTYAPVVRLSGLRILLSVAVNSSMHIHSMDVKNAFLNSVLEHDVYMHQPEGYVDKVHPDYVCKLEKAVYGLKQSPRQWYNTIRPVLESVGVNPSPSDSGIFSGIVDGTLVLLGIYVDDLFIACADMDVLRNVKEKLSSEFAMKDIGSIKHYLGMDIDYKFSEGEVILSQGHYVSEVLKRFGMDNCKSSPTPMEAKLVLHPHVDGVTKLTEGPYRQLVGSIMYLMLCTRPDISFSTGVLSRFLSNPTEMHWKSAKRVLRYLQGTSGMKLSFKKTDGLDIVAYCDADWASSFDRRSTTGYVIYVGNNLVAWKSKKQSTIALSSTEAEIIAATETMREVMWVRNVIESFGIKTTTPTLYCDSQPAIAISNTTGYHGRSKHMDVKYKFMSECVEDKNVDLRYVPSDENIADTLTKPLSRALFTKFAESIRLLC